jgi:hypothetical protein
MAKKKPGSMAGFSSKNMNSATLPDRIEGHRSTRTRRHAGGHAGAGQDVGGGEGAVHQNQDVT